MCVCFRAAPQKNPSSLWNAMVAPILPMTIYGTIWYQGNAVLLIRFCFFRFTLLLNAVILLRGLLFYCYRADSCQFFFFLLHPQSYTLSRVESVLLLLNVRCCVCLLYSRIVKCWFCVRTKHFLSSVPSKRTFLVCLYCSI